MKTTSKDLITDLQQRTRQNLKQAQELLAMEKEQLNHRNSPHSWSALECIAHLNFYGQFYLPEIKKRIIESRFPPEEVFRPGLLGDYFAKMMLPGKKKMKTFKTADFKGSDLDKKVPEEFVAQQKQLLELLELAKKVSLNRIKTSISISKFIKLKLGDIFRVVIYHNERHLLQAQRALTPDESNAGAA